jgi:hypothetical protein
MDRSHALTPKLSGRWSNRAQGRSGTVNLISCCGVTATLLFSLTVGDKLMRASVRVHLNTELSQVGTPVSLQGGLGFGPAMIDRHHKRQAIQAVARYVDPARDARTA